MDIQTHASLASTRFVQLRTTVRRVRDAVVMVDTLEAATTYSLPYECITVGADVTRAALAAGAPVVAAYWPTVQSDTVDPSDLQFLIATPDFEIPGPDQLRLIMSDFGDHYPHIGDWDGSSADAVAKLAALLRYKRVVSSAAAAAPALHLVTQLWRPKQGRRWRELCEALRRNAANPFVSRIHVLLESDDAADAWAKWPANLKEKIVATVAPERLTFRAFRDAALKVDAGSEDFFALVNADIYFDRTIRELWAADMDTGPTCLALLRYEASLEDPDADAKPFGPRDDSQDAWIFRRDHLAAATDWVALTIPLGRAGCDNAIAGELVRRRWRVANPSSSIKALHLHESGLRTYRRDDMISLGVYATVAPTGLLESPLLGASAFRVAAKIEVEKVTKYAVVTEDAAAMDLLYKTVMPAKIGLPTSVGSAATERATLSVLEAPAGATVTADGLVAVGDGIGWSDDKDASDLAWTQTEYSSLTPTVAVDWGIFIPLRARHLGDEMLQVGRALALAAAVGRTDLVLPAEGARLLQPLVGGALRLRALGGRAMVCKAGAYGFLPSLERGSADWAGPAVAALRSVVGARIAPAENVTWTTFDLDLDVLDQWSDALDEVGDGGGSRVAEHGDGTIQNFHNKNTPPSRIIAAMKASSVVVGSTWTTGYMWAARPGTVYVDPAPEAANAAMATICGLRYVPMTLDAAAPAATFTKIMRALRIDV